MTIGFEQVREPSGHLRARKLIDTAIGHPQPPARKTIPNMKLPRNFIVGWFLLALIPRFAAAQVENGNISGTVRAPDGTLIPGVSVRVVNENSGTVVEVITGESGAYQATALEPGEYRVETTLDGFEEIGRASCRERG